MNKKSNKGTKKGLFKVLGVKKAIAAVTSALALTLFAGNAIYNQLNDEDEKELIVDPVDELIANEENKQNDEQAQNQDTSSNEEQVEEKNDVEVIPEKDEDYYLDDEDNEEELASFLQEDKEEQTEQTEKTEQTEQTVGATDDFADLIIPNINAYKGKGYSIIDALNLCGYPSDAEYRARLAAYFGITNYQRTAEQNLLLMDYLYQYYAYLDTNTNTNPNTNTKPNQNEGNSGNDGETAGEENNKDEGNHGTDDEEEKQHECHFGSWTSLDDDNEIRKCSCGKQETRRHPSYGPWLDLGNGKEARICNSCGHVQERTKQQENECDHTLGAWESVDDTYEVRRCSCGAKEEKQPHPYGPWLDLGNGKEARICNNCGHVQERTKQEEDKCDHTLGAWEAVDDTYEVRRCECGQEEEKQPHPYGAWVDNGDGTCSRTCPNCNHKETMPHHIDTWVFEDNDNEVGYCKESGCLVRRGHPLGDPTVTYRDNGDGTHTKVSVYHCSSCNSDITKEETFAHDSGSLVQVDDNYHKLVCGECQNTIQDNIPHDFTHHDATDDAHISHSCDCGYGYIEDLSQECVHNWVDAGRFDNPNPTAGDYCYVYKDVCNNCGEERIRETIDHDFIDGECDECGVQELQTTANFDYEVDAQDDFDHEVSEEDDFDLTDEDIPETAYLDLSREDIEYMADKAIVRLDLENALNEEIAKGLTLTYKG